MATASQSTAPATPQLPLASHPTGKAVRMSPEVIAQFEAAEAAFRRDLPALLGERPGQWVAYLGPQCLGFAPTKSELYVECRARAIPLEQTHFCCIEPLEDEVLIGPGIFVG